MSPVAVEHVDVHVAVDALHAAVGAELPDGQPHVGLVLAIAGNPYVVALFQVGGGGEVLADERLAEIEYGARAGVSLYVAEPCAHAAEQGGGPSDAAYLCVGGFDVEHGRQVAATEQGVVDKVSGLLLAACLEREEVVCSGAQSAAAGCQVVAHVVGIADGRSFGRLDEDEGDGEVAGSADALAAEAAQVCDAQPVPVDGVVSPPASVLVSRYVDAVDALRGVFQPFAFVEVVGPFAGAYALLADGESESVALSAAPAPFVVGAVGGGEAAVALGFEQGSQLAAVDAGGVADGGLHHGVGAPQRAHQAAAVVGGYAVALLGDFLPTAVFPDAALVCDEDFCLRPGLRGAAQAGSIFCHHVVALVLHVVRAQEVV